MEAIYSWQYAYVHLYLYLFSFPPLPWISVFSLQVFLQDLLSEAAGAPGMSPWRQPRLLAHGKVKPVWEHKYILKYWNPFEKEVFSPFTSRQA